MPLHKLREAIRAKLRSVSGFSFAELLVTTLILLLMTEIVVDGLPAVIDIYRRTVDVANAEAYLSTTAIALRSKLSLSREEAKNGENGEKAYFDPQYGYYRITNSADGIQIEYLDVDMEPRNPKMIIPLIPEVRNDTSILISGFDNITYNNGSFTITGLKVEKQNSESENPLAEVGENIIIRTLNP